MPPPKSAMRQKESEKKKTKAAFMISGPARGGQRALSAKPTQREPRTATTTFQHNWERAKQQCHEILAAPLPRCDTTTDIALHDRPTLCG